MEHVNNAAQGLKMPGAFGQETSDEDSFSQQQQRDQEADRRARVVTRDTTQADAQHDKRRRPSGPRDDPYYFTPSDRIMAEGTPAKQAQEWHQDNAYYSQQEQVSREASQSHHYLDDPHDGYAQVTTPQEDYDQQPYEWEYLPDEGPNVAYPHEYSQFDHTHGSAHRLEQQHHNHPANGYPAYEHGHPTLKHYPPSAEVPQHRDRSSRYPNTPNHNHHETNQPFVQINSPPPAPANPPAQAPTAGFGETLQTLMMSQMMMQQMQAQQMQQAQMAALSANALNGQAQGGAGDRHCEKGCRKKKSTSVNIQNCNAGQSRGKRKVKPIGIVPIIQPALVKRGRALGAAPPPLPPSESSALDNWQEATIILCLAIVGLIYLVSSRASPEKKEASAAARHLT